MPTQSPATGSWFEPTLETVDDYAWYLVQTNGMEWRDHDLHVMKGMQVASKLRPDYVRGRPVLVAQIIRPS